MRISYNKLWKMLIDKNMNKRDLAEKSGVSSASIAKLSKGANITTDVLLKICESLDCTLEDIMETVKDVSLIHILYHIFHGLQSKKTLHFRY